MPCSQDQMEHLERLKVRAESINSKMTSADRQRVFTDLQAVVPATRLLYITPEQADTGGFQVRSRFSSVNIMHYAIQGAQ